MLDTTCKPNLVVWEKLEALYDEPNTHMIYKLANEKIGGTIPNGR